MKSYSAIDRIEGNFAVCEVEMLEMEESKTSEYFSKETKMMDILLEKISVAIDSVKEGDIIVVEHDGKNITSICYKDEAEKQRRMNILKAIMEQ